MTMANRDDSEIISNFGDPNADADDEREEGEEEEEEEEEEEGEEEEEEEEEEEGEGEPELTPEELRSIAAGDDVVSRARLNEVLQQNRELMGLVGTLAKDRVASPAAAAAAAAPAAPAFPLMAKIKAANKALLDGNEDEAATIQMEIEQYRQAEATKAAIEKATAAAEKSATEAAEKNAVESAIAAALDRYPFLNDEHPAFSKETVADMVMYRDRYIREGYTHQAAIEKAASKVCEPILQQSGSATGQKKKPIVMTPAQKLRNARAASAQPPALHKAGVSARGKTDPENLDIENMSDEAWDALPRAVKDRLKGVR